MQLSERFVKYPAALRTVATAAAVAVTLGLAPASAATAAPAADPALSVAAVQAVRADLNGQRFIDRRTNAVYLVLDGKRSWIPDPGTYNNLFRDWRGIKDVVDIESIDLGPTLTSGAHLGRAHGRTAVYLISNGVKRHVTSMAAMNRYYFDLGKVVNLPAVTIDSIPTGTQIN